MAKVLFVIRKSRSHTGKFKLYCRITANRQTREFSTEETIYKPEQWNQERQIYDLEGTEGEYINLLCDKLKYNIKTIYLSLNGSVAVSPDKIIDQLKEPNKKPVPARELISDYIKHLKENTGRSSATIEHYEIYLKNFIEFEANTFYSTDLTLIWATRFKEFLKNKPNDKRPCKNKTRASRHVEFFRNALDHAKRAGIIKENPLEGYQQERDKPKEVVFLDGDERKAWMNAKFENKLLSEIKDLYLFQISVGVAYGNIWAEYKVKDIPDVGKIFVGNRIKGNHQAFFVPFNTEAENLLNKYNGKMPYYDNSTYNKTIKIIAEILGIKKHLTTHTGRKTCAMKMDAEGWSKPAIQYSLGHGSIRTTETYYMTASIERLIHEMSYRQKNA